MEFYIFDKIKKIPYFLKACFIVDITNIITLQEPPRHTQSATSVIINPVAVDDFRTRVQGVASERIQAGANILLTMMLRINRRYEQNITKEATTFGGYPITF